jgi:RNA polymerase sigma-70 factor (ECF subfamily)
MPEHTSGATVDLLERIKAGDSQAGNRLLERVIPALRRWARGRLPQWLRTSADTQDLVQDVVVRALPRLSSFEPRAGGMQAFLRTALQHRVIDEIRRVKTNPALGTELELHADPSPSPLEYAIKREGIARYEQALASLSQADQQAIRGRIEQQQSYEELAAALGKPTPSAARMAVRRAIGRLLRNMADHLKPLGPRDKF